MNHEDAVVVVLLSVAGAWLLRPLVTALARRMTGDAGPGAGAGELAALRAELLAEVRAVREEVGELAERLDFTERLLAKPREGERLAPPR